MNDDVLRSVIPEQVTPGKRLGRHIVHDPRSRNFPADGAAAITSVVHNATGLPLNQGDIGSCTANALCGALNSAPDFKGGVATHRDRRDHPLRARDQARRRPVPSQRSGRQRSRGVQGSRAARLDLVIPARVRPRERAARPGAAAGHHRDRLVHELRHAVGRRARRDRPGRYGQRRPRGGGRSDRRSEQARLVLEQLGHRPSVSVAGSACRSTRGSSSSTRTAT